MLWTMSANCIFCHGQSESKRSREHLLSKPVVAAFDVDVAGEIWHPVDGALPESRGSLADLKVHISCKTCNETWMNDLEHGMAEVVAPWLRAATERLSDEGLRILSRWAIKTHLGLASVLGGARAFMTDRQDEQMAAIPEITRGRAVWRNDPEPLRDVVVALSRVGETMFSHGFGNPTVVPKGPKYLNARSVGVSFLTLGTLRVWCIVPSPLLSPERVRLPTVITRAAAGLPASHLRWEASGAPSFTDITVRYPDHDADAAFALAQVSVSKSHGVQG
jgi:hypothetical protein